MNTLLLIITIGGNALVICILLTGIRDALREIRDELRKP